MLQRTIDISHIADLVTMWSKVLALRFFCRLVILEYSIKEISRYIHFVFHLWVLLNNNPC